MPAFYLPRRGLGGFVLATSLVLASASIAQEQGGDAQAGEAVADPALTAAIELGNAEYLKSCRPCHGSKGTAGVPLAGNEKVSAGPDYLVWAILTGPGYMPDFAAALSDEQIAAIATFIGNSWGNANGIVAPEDVAAVR